MKIFFSIICGTVFLVLAMTSIVAQGSEYSLNVDLPIPLKVGKKESINYLVKAIPQINLPMKGSKYAGLPIAPIAEHVSLSNLLGPFIKVAASAITTSGLTGNISACVGAPSSSPNILRFTMSGSELISNVNITAPSDFEISLTADKDYSN